MLSVSTDCALIRGHFLQQGQWEATKEHVVLAPGRGQETGGRKACVRQAEGINL